MNVHASCIAIDGQGVLLWGESGVGKSDLALRMIEKGAILVADDYPVLEEKDGILYASCPKVFKENWKSEDWVFLNFRLWKKSLFGFWLTYLPKKK